jgi:hypothetical protein
MSSWPAWAGPLLPDTGASTNITSGRNWPSRPAISVVAGRPAAAAALRLVPVPDKPELATLIARAASRAGELWAAHCGLS